MIGLALIAPSGYAPDIDAVNQELDLLSRQLRLFNYYDHSKRYQRFGGTDDERIAQIYQASENPEVDIVVSLRGGYGMTRLLPRLDFNRLAKSQKLFVGHSDFTAFHLALLKAGAQSFSGPMFCIDFTRKPKSELTMQSLWQCLKGPTYTVSWEKNQNRDIDVSGTLWGGNLSMIMSLIGTPYLPTISNGILFLEDVNEHPYRVERMLLQLQQSGLLAKQQAIVLGDFSSYSITDYDNGYNMHSMFHWVAQQIDIPLIFGLPFGHIPDKVTLPVGAKCHLLSDQQHIHLTVSSYPTLKEK